MIHHYILYLVDQTRHKELLRIAEEERLVKAALNNRSGNPSLSIKISEWLRACLPESGKHVESSRERHRISVPCCSVTES
jgi:hypothetical protein